MGFSIYDILNEAPEDENPETINAGDTAGDDNAPADNQDNTQDTGADDDFSIDTDLDDGGDDTDTGEEGGDTQDFGNDDTGGTGEGTDDEPVEANTDMFSSLSAEEQVVKIAQLKQQYADLYDSCDSILEKINNVESNETTIIPVSRISASINDLKGFIMDYLYQEFANKSYYENDVMFNRFLTIFKSVSNILETIARISSKNV